MDLACGSGEATQIVTGLGGSAVGVDPYTHEAYRQHTGQIAQQVAFEDIAVDGLGDAQYSLVVCSYALHLVEPSWMPGLLYQLGLVAPLLLVASPHKRPDLTKYSNVTKVAESYDQRVRMTLYQLPG